MCSFPNATLVLDPKNHRLMVGQHYSIEILMEVPDSVANQVDVIVVIVVAF